MEVICHGVVCHGVVSHGGGLSAGRSHARGLSCGWPALRVVCHDGGLLSGWSLISVVSRQGDLSSGLSVIRVVSRQGGLSSGLSVISVVSHQSGHSPLAPLFKQSERENQRSCLNSLVLRAAGHELGYARCLAVPPFPGLGASG